MNPSTASFWKEVFMPLPRGGKDWLAWAALFIAYLGASFVGVWLFRAPSVIFPAAGIALAMLYIYGLRLWPAIFLSALLVGSIAHSGSLAFWILPIAHTLQAIIGAACLRLLKVNPFLRRVKDMFSVIGVSVVTAVIVPSVWFAARAIAAHFMPVSATMLSWSSWWAGMITSLLATTPLLMRWGSKPAFTRDRVALLEILLAFAVLVGISIPLWWTNTTVIFGISLLYLLLIPCFYIALRLGVRFTTLAMTLATALALAGELFGVHAHDPALGMRLVQTEILMNILTVIFFILVSIEEERKEAVFALKMHIEQLENALQRVEEETIAKSRFIAVLAHELRNPLAPVVSFLELLKLRGLVKREGEEIVDLMSDRMAVVRRLLDDLLDMSRITERKIELRKEAVDLETIVRRSLKTVENLFERKNQSCAFRGPSAPIVAEADPIRIEQSITNLLSNASKYTPSGGSIAVELSEKGGSAQIRVADTGIGIQPNLLETVFEPFRQVFMPNVKSDGLGIGLALAKQFVEMHGGEIRAESAGLGHGSTFTISLPLARTGSYPIVNEGEEIRPAPPNGTRVLVVDDNIAAAESLIQLLTLTGYSARSAYTGAEAIQKVSLWKPHAILLDLGLPDIDGYEVARTIKEKGYGGTIAALTGYGQSDDKRRTKEVGCDFHLVKPVNLADIQTVLARAA